MVLTLGSRLGPYEILSPLGAGGVGGVILDCRFWIDSACPWSVVSGPLPSQAVWIVYLRFWIFK